MIKIKLKIKNSKLKMREGFAPLVLVIIIGIVLAAGGLGLGLAWKAGLIGKPGGGPTDGTTTNGTQPPPSDGTENGEEDPTKDWETYVSEKYGYSIKYPKDRNAEVGNGGSPIRPADMVSFDSISISVESSGGMSAKEFINTIILREADPEASNAKYEDTVLGGLGAIKVSHDYPGTTEPTSVFYSAVVKEGLGYYAEVIIEVDPDTGQPAESSRAVFEVYEMMLTTFEFI